MTRVQERSDLMRNNDLCPRCNFFPAETMENLLRYVLLSIALSCRCCCHAIVVLSLALGYFTGLVSSENSLTCANDC